MTHEEVVIADLTQVVVECRMIGLACRGCGAMPGDDIVFADQIGREIEPATKPPGIAGAQKAHVHVTRGHMRVARVHDDGNSHRAEAASGKMWIPAGCRWRQARATDIRKTDAGALEYLSAFQDCADTASGERCGGSFASPGIGDETCAIQLAEQLAQVLLQRPQIAVYLLFARHGGSEAELTRQLSTASRNALNRGSIYAMETKGATGFDIGAFLHSEAGEHRLAFESLLETLSGPFTQTLSIWEAAIRRGGKLLFFGNGGSASDSQHLAAECVIRYHTDRPAIAAIALTTDTSALTAGSNDMGFERIFARQIEALGRAGDVAVGLSTSGRSRNVLNGLREARHRGLQTVGLIGGDGGDMRELCDVSIVVPSAITARVQEMHIFVGHLLCKALEQRLGLVT